MKKIIFASVTIITVLMSAGCGKNCRDAACPSIAVPFFAFRITNAANKDLLTGPAKIYDSSQVMIKARRNNSSNLENITRFFSFTSDTFALTGFNVTQAYRVYYLQLNGVTTDSLFFKYNENLTDCCDLSTYTFNQFNSNVITPAKLPATFVIVK
jgi:hypothetical protein